MARHKLTGAVQLFIVQQLATFEKPSAVLAALKENFGVEVAFQAVAYYDISNPNLPKKWKQVFEETRARFLEDTAAIPIANKAFRLKELDRLYHRTKATRLENPVDQRATLEQAAKEAGDAFTNRQKIEHDGTVGTYVMSKFEWERTAAEKLEEVEKRTKKFSE